MNPEHLGLVTVGIGMVALLYSSVGHAGASGYIAVMTLAGMAPSTIKPVALTLNILVAAIAFWQFRAAGWFLWSLFWPFAIASVPFAFLGGLLNLPAPVLRILMGLVLLLSAVRFFVNPDERSDVRPPGAAVSIGAGAVLGLLAGCTGTGGGIFLTPLMILMGWAHTKTAGGVSALFILLNSAAGLAGHVGAARSLPAFTWWFAAAAALCGIAGSYSGSRRLPPQRVCRLLATVLTVAGLKLVLMS